MVGRGLLAITRDHGVRSLSIVYKNALFTVQSIANVEYSAIVREGKTIPLTDSLERYTTLLRAFVSIINIAANMTNSRYYTFLGEFKLNFNKKRFKYEPYVDLMKKITIKIDTRAISIVAGEQVKRFRRSKSGYTPEAMIETLTSILCMMESL